MSSISAGTTTTTGYVVSSDTTGALVLKTGASGTTALTIGSDQSVTFVGSQTLSGGTANGVLYLNGSKVATSGSALVFDGTNLGVGTVSPATPLDVTKAGGANFVATFQNTTAATPYCVFIKDAASSTAGYPLLAVTNSTGASTYFRVDSNTGNVGVGTSSPASRLNVSSTGESFTISGGGTGTQYQRFNTSGGNYYIGTSSSTGTGLLSGASAYSMCLVTESARDICFGTNNTERARIDSSGNFGIGTATPYSRLDLGSYGSQSQLSWHQDATTSYGTIGLQNNSAAIGLMSGLKMGASANSFASSISSTWGKSAVLLNYGSIQFFTNAPDAVTYGTTYTATERARIDSSGNLLVGKTSSTATTVGFETLSNGSVYSTMSASTNSTSTLNIYSTGASAYRFYVGMGGTIFATSTVITAISDQRLKENVRDIDTGLNAIMTLKPRRFDWKEGKGQDKKNAAGFIAQEFEEVFPECVGTSKAGEDGIEYKNINHETLIPTLVKAIQEQQAIIESLTQRIAALEGR